MKRNAIKTAVMSLLLMLAVVTALADGKNLKGSISLSRETRVNDTLKLKPGRYEVKFDAKTNKLTISDEYRVNAIVSVSVRDGQEKPDATQARTFETDQEAVLRSVVFKGDHRVIIVTESEVADR